MPVVSNVSDDEILELANSLESEGKRPTVREIAKTLHCNSNRVQRLLAERQKNRLAIPESYKDIPEKLLLEIRDALNAERESAKKMAEECAAALEREAETGALRDNALFERDQAKV